MKVLIAIASCRRDTHNGFNQAVRDTWLKDIAKFPEIDYKFFVGDGTVSNDYDDAAIWALSKGAVDKNRGMNYEEKCIRRAQEAFAEPQITPQADEIVLQCPDDYVHISVKVREMFRWAYAHGYDFVFKCETDTYVELARLMRSGFEKHDFIGGPNGRCVAGGAGWWVSRKTMALVLDEQVKGFGDDCWFPIIAQAKGIVLHHDKRYSDDPVTPYNNIITTHVGFKAGYTPERMYTLRKMMDVVPKRAIITISSWVTGAMNGDNQAVRDTYAQDIAEYDNLSYRFFIGDGTPISAEDEKRLEPSFVKAGRGHKEKVVSTKVQAPFTYTPKDDEVIVPCPDGYFYMSHKTWHSHRWALDHGYDYVFQCFPDTFIDVHKLMKSGYRDHDFIGLDVHKNFCAGGCGYWLSRKATEAILSAPIDDWAEDRWIGNSLKARGIHLHHDGRYGAPGFHPAANNDLITEHLCATPEVYKNNKMRDAYAQSKVDVSSVVMDKYPNAKKHGRAPLRNNLVIDWFDTHPRK